jgi:hypothetical protein
VLRVASIGQIKFLSELRKLSSIAGSTGQRTSIQPVLIAYYSGVDAMRAIENLDGNGSLSRSEPLVLEYVGTGDETKISKDWFSASARVSHPHCAYS